MQSEQFSNGFSYASLACSLSLWLVLGLYYLFDGLHITPPGWRWVVLLPGWKWALFEAFSLLLAIIATVLGVIGAKLWRIALPVALLMFLLTLYSMGS